MYLNTQNFHHEIKALLPEFQAAKFLLALSGGADSMVLAQLFIDLKLNFEAAHINYKLRGEDSDLDQEVVVNFCLKNNIKFHLRIVTEGDEKPEHSIQVWARNLRYAFFEKIKVEEKLEYIVTAHHLNDELETFFINLSRASGLKGLSGIPANNNEIIRPLLKFSKIEIYKFASENNISFREDLSNQKSDYLRNKIRNEIVPKMLDVDINFLENFSRSLTHLKQAEEFVEHKIEDLRREISLDSNSKTIFNKMKLTQQTDFLKFEILKSYGFTKSEEIAKIFSAENGSRFFSKNYQIKVSSTELIISKKSQPEYKFEAVTIVKCEAIYLRDYCVNYLETGKIWQLDSHTLNWPLKLRQILPTDIFTPAGMEGKKKVSKFIKDLKIKELSPKPLVLADAKDSILGIVPYRQSGNYITSSDTNGVKIYL